MDASVPLLFLKWLYLFYSVSVNFPLLLWFLGLCSFESRCTSVCMFLKIQINNNQSIVGNCTWKYLQDDINNQVPLTPHSRLWNRLRWFLTAVLKLINKQNQNIRTVQDILNKLYKKNWRKGPPYLFLTFVRVGTIFFPTGFNENYKTKNLTQNPLFLWIQMYLHFSVSQTPDQKQEINH